MKLTTNHENSKNGIPVFVDDDGRVMDYAYGVRTLRKNNKWSVKDLANRVGVSHRTVENWEQSRTIGRQSLMLLKNLMDRIETE